MGDVLMTKATLKTYSIPVTCSCTHCDSLFCFAKRHGCQSCSCESCKSKYCCPENIQTSNSKLISAYYLNAAKAKPVPQEPVDLTESDINYESERNIIIMKNQPPKSLDEYINRLFTNTTSDKFSGKLESLRGYIDFISGKKRKALNKYIQGLKETSSIEPVQFMQRYKCKENCRGKCQKQFKTQNIHIVNGPLDSKCKEKCKEFETEVRSVMLGSPNINFSPENKKLIAQDNSSKSSVESFYTAESCIDTYDIFRRIRDAYNACTCKPCECIPTISNQNNICSCEPCKCLDCTSYMSTNKFKIRKQRYGFKCNPSEYIRQCIKQTQEKQVDCSCEPCDCALCQDANFAKSCDCDECRCNECRSSVKPAGAPSGDKLDAACTKCAHEHITDPKKSTLKLPADKEISTSCYCKVCPNNCAVGIECCKCKGSSFSSLNKEVRDYDMQTALILNDIFFHNNNTKNIEDIRAMYAALPQIQEYISERHAKTCNCNECECLTCACKEDTINSIKSSQLFCSHRRYSPIRKISSSSKKYSQYDTINDSQVCPDSKHQREAKSPKSTNQSSETNALTCSCKCDSCLCTGVSSQPIRPYGHCKCQRCFGNESVHTRSISNEFPMKKGEVLSPLAHQTKIQKQMFLKNRLPASNLADRSDKLNQYLNSDKSQREIYNYFKKSNITPIDKYKPLMLYHHNIAKKNTAEIGTGFVESGNRSNIFKYDACVQCQWNKENLVHNNIFSEKVSRSCVSVYPSMGSISKVSLCKEDDSATFILSNSENKSLESFSGSSSYDQLRYIIRFPKSTAETCVEQVLKANLANDIKLNKFDKSLIYKKELTSGKNHPQTSVYKLIYPKTSFSTTTKEIDNLQSYKIKNNNLMKGNIYYYEPKKYVFTKQATDDIKIKNEEAATSSSSCSKECEAFKSIEAKSVGTMTNNNNKYFVFIHDINQVDKACNTVSYYNILDKKNTYTVGEEYTSTKLKESTFKLLSHNFDCFNINLDEDYEKVKNTIRDANEFSLKLLELLESYEKANKEFKKISDRLTNQELFEIDCGRFAAQAINFEKSGYENKGRHYNEKYDTNISKYGDNYFALTSRDENVLKRVERTHKRSNKKLCIPTKHVYNIPRKICLIKPSPIFATDMNSLGCTADLIIEKQSTLITEDQPCKDNENIQPDTPKNNLELNLIMGIFDPILANIDHTPAIPNAIDLSENPSTDEAYLQTEEPSMIIPPTQSPTNIEYEFRNEDTIVSCKSNLQLQKPFQVDKLIGDQLVYNDKEVSCGELESMNALEDNVRELLNEYVLQSIGKERISNKKVKDKKSYLCYGNQSSLKVNFLLVRKVSDHTVLVKWSQPRDLSDVKGYELLVDGRAVQTIFNPSKCIAVVTCLPHTDKILLTIRTVTSVVEENGLFPATTIIYRPRVRKQ